MIAATATATLRPGARTTAVLLVASIACASAVHAQSLADVARRESARRGPKGAGRVYTNADLQPTDPAPPPAAPVAPAASAAAGTTADIAADKSQDMPAATGPAEPPVKAREKRDEQYWRARAKDLHDRVAKANADVTATRSRLDALDAAPPSPSVIQERAVTAAALTRLQNDAQAMVDELGRFNALAAANKISADWIR